MNGSGRLVGGGRLAQNIVIAKMTRRPYHKSMRMTEGQVALEERAPANHGHTWILMDGKAWIVLGLGHEARVEAKSISQHLINIPRAFMIWQLILGSLARQQWEGWQAWPLLAKRGVAALTGRE